VERASVQASASIQTSAFQTPTLSASNTHEALVNLSAAAAAASNPQPQPLNLGSSSTTSNQEDDHLRVPSSTSLAAIMNPSSSSLSNSEPNYNRFDEAQLLLNAALSPAPSGTPERHEEPFSSPLQNHSTFSGFNSSRLGRGEGADSG